MLGGHASYLKAIMIYKDYTKDLEEPIVLDVIFQGGLLDGKESTSTFARTKNMIVTIETDGVKENYKFEDPNIFRFTEIKDAPRRRIPQEQDQEETKE